MLLSDPSAKLIQQIGIGFKTRLLLKGFIATKRQKGETSEIMPMPTVVILDDRGKILFEYVNPNDQESISSDLILVNLKILKY